MSEKTYMPEDIDSAATQQAVYNMVLYLPLKEMDIDDGTSISEIVTSARKYAKTHNDKEVRDLCLPVRVRYLGESNKSIEEGINV